MSTETDHRDASDANAIVPSLQPFDRAFLLLLGHEGGYANRDLKADPGGETKYGISRKRFPHVDIKNLTIEGAKALYREHFWMAFRCGEMPWPIGYAFWDCVVQHNPTRPIMWLQEAVGARVDGILGSGTVLAARECREPIGALIKLMHRRSNYRPTLSNYAENASGWRKRDLTVVAEAVQYWGKP